MPVDTVAALALVRTALAKAAAQDKKLVYAQARKVECIDLVYGDDPERGEASCEDAFRVFLAGLRPHACQTANLLRGRAAL